MSPRRRVLFVALVTSSCSSAQPSADAIFVGTILTMDSSRPTAEAIAIRQGRILALGSRRDVMRHKDDQTRVVELRGQAMLPGFIDAHSHVTGVAARMAEVNLSPPPVGDVTSIGDIQRKLQAALSTGSGKGGLWLVASAYDHTRLAERRRLTRHDLDKVSTTVPILVKHFSGHMRVVNSKGLSEAGIGQTTPDPPGGRVRRSPDNGEPTGELEETAQLLVDKALNSSIASPNAASAVARRAEELLEASLRLYAAAGFTTVSEAWADSADLTLLRRMATAGRLRLDVVAFPHYAEAPASALAEYSRTYANHLRIGGVKIDLDGGSPGRTAYLREPYYKQLPGEVRYRGYPRFRDQAELNDMIVRYYKMSVPVLIHALGDAAVDQAITAISTAEQTVPQPDRRTQLIHLQQVQEDQLDALTRLRVTLTFQVAHVFYFGDLHYEEIFGPQRAARLTPVRSAIDRGLAVSIHHDAPVHPVDQMTLVSAVVNRQTIAGRVLGPSQRISAIEALQASTIGPAYQFFEERQKGSLDVGKLADLVIVERNPLSEPPGSLRTIRVVETIKEGTTIFRAERSPN